LEKKKKKPVKRPGSKKKVKGVPNTSGGCLPGGTKGTKLKKEELQNIS